MMVIEIILIGLIGGVVGGLIIGIITLNAVEELLKKKIPADSHTDWEARHQIAVFASKFGALISQGRFGEVEIKEMIPLATVRDLEGVKTALSLITDYLKVDIRKTVDQPAKPGEWVIKSKKVVTKSSKNV